MNILKFYSLLFFLIFSNNVLARIKSSKENYKTFDGREVEVILFEGEFTVLLLDANIVQESQLNDSVVISKIINLIDGYYSGFASLYGIEPLGGNSKFKNKANVFFGQPSCGAACGLIGFKGIEVGGTFWTNIFNEVKYQTNSHQLSIVGYEFGRNFFTFSDKVLFPYNSENDERNGGFAEGFANLGYLESYLKGVYPNLDSDQQGFQETFAYHRELQFLLLAYLNDLNSNPYNSLLRENLIIDFNRNSWGLDNPSYLASGILVGTYNLFGKPSLSKFMEVLKNRDSSKNLEYSLGTLALGFSRALNLNLNNYFKNVLKFQIDNGATQNIGILPSIESDKLIKDLPELYFSSPFDTLNLNIRSIDYNPSNSIVMYKVTKMGQTIFENSHGNNKLDYSIFGNQDSVILQIQLLEGTQIIDSYLIKVLKRKKITLNSPTAHLYSYMGLGKVTSSNGLLFIENISSKFEIPEFDNNIILQKYPLFPDRKIRLSGELKNIPIDDNESSCNVALGGRWGSHGTSRVGLDIGKQDSINFYSVSLIFNVNDYFFKDEEQRSYKFLTQEFWLSTNNSICLARDVIIEDITDTDKDGIIDFDDNCPLIYNPVQYDSNFNGLGDLCDDETLNKDCKFPIIKDIELTENEANIIIDSFDFDKIELYLEKGTEKNDTLIFTNENILIPNLTECLEFNLKGKVICGSKESDIFEIGTFKTEGCQSTSLKENEKFFDLKIYPNPFNSIINIELATGNQQLRIEIFDFQGKLLKIINSDNSSLVITDLVSLNAGVYLVKIIGKDYIESRRILKIY